MRLAVILALTFLPALSPAVAQPDLDAGRRSYEVCAGCHGFEGEGVEGLGLPLVTSPLVLYASDLELMIFLRVGRPADHPDNSLVVDATEDVDAVWSAIESEVRRRFKV